MGVNILKEYNDVVELLKGFYENEVAFNIGSFINNIIAGRVNAIYKIEYIVFICSYNINLSHAIYKNQVRIWRSNYGIKRKD